MNLAYFLVTLLTVKLFWMSGLYCFYRLSRETDLSLAGSLRLTLALGVGSLHLTWSSTFNNHFLAASSLIIGFSLFDRAAREAPVLTESILERPVLRVGRGLGHSDGHILRRFRGHSRLGARASRKDVVLLGAARSHFRPSRCQLAYAREHLTRTNRKVLFQLSRLPVDPGIRTLSGTEVNSLSHTAVYGLGLLLGLLLEGLEPMTSSIAASKTSIWAWMSQGLDPSQGPSRLKIVARLSGAPHSGRSAVLR